MHETRVSSPARTALIGKAREKQAINWALDKLTARHRDTTELTGDLAFAKTQPQTPRHTECPGQARAGMNINWAIGRREGGNRP